jgi:hypothetical protein
MCVSFIKLGMAGSGPAGPTTVLVVSRERPGRKNPAESARM